MKKVAIIVAAGNGTRMNSETPKQFLLLQNKPLLFYTIRAFVQAFDDMEIILVLPPSQIAKGQEIVDGFFDNSRFRFCEGGRTRFHSVQNGVQMLGDEASIVFVRDGARCFVSTALIQKCYEQALAKGTAIPAIAPSDSVRWLNEGDNQMLDRKDVRLVQTPQTFLSTILVPAYNIDYKEHFTDEAAVVEAYGLKINLVEGEENNFKITTPLDYIVAANLIQNIESEETVD